MDTRRALARGMPSYSLPESERYASENIALPMFAELTDGEVEYVISAVEDYFSARVIDKPRVQDRDLGDRTDT